MHPIAQRLAVHAAGSCRHLAVGAIQHHGQRQQAAGLRGIVRPRRLLAQLGRGQLQSPDRYCHH